MNDNNMLWLQKWYYKNCNQDWEHDRIVQIGTIDNPGWSVTIQIYDTDLENREFQNINYERTEDDWVFCEVKKAKFEGRCGPINLLEILQIFRNWVESEKKDI